jgi:hypothetical protein
MNDTNFANKKQNELFGRGKGREKVICFKVKDIYGIYNIR